MKNKLMKEFERLYQLQEMIADLSTKDLYDDLGTSDTHCIQLIGKLKEANGVQLAENLQLTRGAVSKITSRLAKKGYLSSYKKEDNKKEVFYSLTTAGQEIYERHELAHNNWIQRDKEFLETVSKEKQEIVLEVLQDFNTYIQDRMERMKNDN